MYNNKNVKIMKKNLFLAALAFVAVASCTSDEFVGENTSPTNGNTTDAIHFGSVASKITRATANTGTVAQMLDGQFRVAGVKSSTTNFQKVFDNYGVWNTTPATGTWTSTTSDSHQWEYVEPSTTGVAHGSTDNPMSVSNQTIKYWDHSANDYRFVAGSPYGAFNFVFDGTTNAIVSATVTGLAGHINPNSSSTYTAPNPIYIAEPLIIPETSYATGYGKAPVTFSFVRQQSRVRVGIFETIPGYKITEIKFYPYGDSGWGSSSSDNIILASTTADYFQGGASDVVVGTITYNWATTPASYSFGYDAASGKTLVQQKNWYGGAYNYAASDPNPAWGEMAITSSETAIGKLYGKDGDMDPATGYFTVLPTAVNTTASPLLIKCDYTLSSEVDGSGETIKVYGATAAIPAAFCKWAPNTSYTYLFKINDNTNGVTSTSHTDKVGLFPITFNAVAVAEATGTEQGYITTVSTPSITTYQEGSVTATGIEYKTGTAINFTVQDDTNGSLKSLNTTGTVGCVKVFWLGNTAQTEADLQVTEPTSALAGDNPNGSTALSLPTSAWDNNGQSITANNYGTFTPGAVGYYAIQYLVTAAEGTTPAVYAYKVVYVGASGS